MLLIGHGKMGQAIEQLAKQRGHEIVGIIDDGNVSELNCFDGSKVDVVIEFTQPDIQKSQLDPAVFSFVESLID